VVLGLVVVGVLAFVVVPQLGGGTPQVKGLLGEPNNWAQVRESGDSSPPKRDNCCMVYDSAVDRVLLFGGNSQQGNDTWAYDPASNTWTNMDPGGSIPVARWGPAQAVLDMPASPLNGVVVMFGGHNNSQAMSLNDTWLYDPVANKWEVAIAGDDSSGDLPTPRLGASMEYDPASGHVLMFGGWNASKYKLYNDLWAYDPVENAWTELVPGGPVPPVRDGSGFARDPGTGKIILFGGVGFDSGLNLVELGDTWSYDPASNSWMELHPATAPSSRDGMNMVYDPHTRLMLLFGGGEEGINVKDDTWAYDPMRNNWENLDPAGLSPSARMNYNMVFDNTRNRIVLFGGAYDHWNVLLGDTWIYTPPLFSH
jgi:N-acetylneuraminic acid mutarotase